MTKVCAYCERPIFGDAIPVPDYAERTAHADAYWHADRAECGRRVVRTSPLDSETSPLQRHLARSLRPRSS